MPKKNYDKLLVVSFARAGSRPTAGSHDRADTPGIRPYN